MLERGEVIKTRRFMCLCVTAISMSIPLALLGLTSGAICVTAYFLVYTVFSYSYLKFLSKHTTCRVNRVELELRDVSAELNVYLTITSGAGFANLRLSLEVPPQLSHSGASITFSSKLALRPGQVEFRVPLLKRTGLHVVGPLVVVITDVLGVFEISVYYLESLVVRIPPKVSVAPIARWYGVIRSSSGARTLTPGLGVEYHSTREYRPEDELRHIDWKATARLGKLHAKVFEVETPLRVIIVLDAQRYTFIGSPKSLFEHCADLAVALSTYLLKRGDSLRLITIVENGVERSDEVRNYGELAELLRILSNVRWPKNIPVLRAEPSLISLKPDDISETFKDVSAVVIFSSLISDRRVFEVVELARRARESGVKVMVVAPLVTFFSTTSRVEDAVYRVLRYNTVSRELKNVELLRKSGIQVIALSPHKALERAVSELERIRVIKTR